MTVKTWFITGTSRGFGREWAIAALDRGDEVAATARDIAGLDDLVAKYGKAILPIRLDVTGDPRATRDAVLKLVDAQDPPLRLFLGDAPLGIATCGLRVPACDLARMAARGRRGPRPRTLRTGRGP